MRWQAQGSSGPWHSLVHVVVLHECIDAVLDVVLHECIDAVSYEVQPCSGCKTTGHIHVHASEKQLHQSHVPTARWRSHNYIIHCPVAGPHLTELNDGLAALHASGSLRVVSLVEGQATQLASVLPKVLIVPQGGRHPGWGGVGWGE